MSIPGQIAPRQDVSTYEPGEPVALFIPCYIDQFYPQVGQACAELLSQHGCPVVFPEGQTCCGQPAFNSGYWDEARDVIHQFCRAFEGHRWIVCPSGSCTAMCRVFFGHVDPDERVVETGRRVFELSEFLVDVLGVTSTGARFPHKVTMHVGCHGQRELGLTDQPRRLLESVQDLEYVELPNYEECCGFGGTFSVKMAGTSLAMGQTKAENIMSTGADVVVSPDTSCLMHIHGIMQRDEQMKHVRAMHLAEVLVQR